MREKISYTHPSPYTEAAYKHVYFNRREVGKVAKDAGLTTFPDQFLFISGYTFQEWSTKLGTVDYVLAVTQKKDPNAPVIARGEPVIKSIKGAISEIKALQEECIEIHYKSPDNQERAKLIRTAGEDLALRAIVMDKYRYPNAVIRDEVLEGWKKEWVHKLNS